MQPAFAATLPLCAGGKRHHCVVDGDTVWLNGEKIRLAGIDAPERGGARCATERALADVATRRLAELLSEGDPIVERSGGDRFGRTLATITVNGRDAGAVLVSEELARAWAGRREPWCAGR